VTQFGEVPVLMGPSGGSYKFSTLKPGGKYWVDCLPPKMRRAAELTTANLTYHTQIKQVVKQECVQPPASTMSSVIPPSTFTGSMFFVFFVSQLAHCCLRWFF